MAETEGWHQWSRGSGTGGWSGRGGLIMEGQVSEEGGTASLSDDPVPVGV